MKPFTCTLISVCLIFLAIWIPVVKSARGPDRTICPNWPVVFNPVLCLRNPCTTILCEVGKKCCPDYSAGCGHQCIAKGIKPEDCPVFPANNACFADPCLKNECKASASETCCPDYSTGCDYHCFT